MASDDSRPKVRMLLTIGVVSLCLLGGIKFVLDSYYLDMTETYEHTLLPRPELLDQTRTEQHAALDKGENGNIPVSVAMQTLASKGRDNASPLVTPQPSDDIDPLKGWSKLKRDVHLPPQITTAAMPMVATDGGAPTATMGTTDAGTLNNATANKDGGVRTAPPQAPTNKDGGK